MAEIIAEYTPPENTTFTYFRHYYDVKDYPLSNSFSTVVGIALVYLLIVKIIGPEFMKNREPYKLKNTIMVYNFIQVVLSVYYTWLGLKLIIEIGLFPKVCRDNDPEIRGKMSYLIYIYWLGKVSELLDTIFFILRKKYNQVSFLHVYHHSSVVVGTFFLFAYAQSLSVIYATFINSAVHIVMYVYYGVSALGPQYAKYLTWKKHITNFQRVQFVSMFLHQLISIIYTTCEYSLLGILYNFISTWLFFALFTNFYIQSYKKKKAAELVANKAQTSEEKDKSQ